MTKHDARPTVLQIGIRQRSLRTCRLGRATELVFILATGVTLALSGQAEAQTWDGEAAGNPSFNLGVNWDGNVAPGPGGAVVIDDGGLTLQPELLNGDVATVGTVSVSAGKLTVSGTLTTTTGATITGGEIQISAPTGLIIGDVETGLAGKLTVDGILTGAMTNGGILEIGATGDVDGPVSTSGTGTNAGDITGTLTVTGGSFENKGFVDFATTVSGGTLELNAGSDLDDAAALLVSGTGTLTVNAADAVGALTQSGGTIDGAATLTATTFGQSGGDLAGVVSSAGAKTLSGGTISGTLTGAGAATVQTGITTVTGTINSAVTVGTGGTLRLDSATAVAGSITTTGSVVSYANAMNEASALIISSATTDLEVLGTDAATQSGVISSTGAFGFEKIGTGTLTVSGVNTYTGATTVTAGTLTAAITGALGTSAGGTSVTSGATLAVTGGVDLADAITLNGAGVGGVGALHNLAGTNNINGTITLGSDTSVLIDAGQLNLNAINGTTQTLTVGGAAGDIHLQGAIATGTGGLIKTGASTVWVEGLNTFTGNTTINGGILDIQGGSALSDSGLVTFTAGQLVVRFNDETVGNIAGAGTIRFTGAQTLTVGDASDQIFSGQIIDTGALTKQGTGKLTLSGTNNYTGATNVNGGILDVTGSIASAVVNVNNGGTLLVDGTSINNGAAVTLTGTGNLTLTGTGTVTEGIGSLAGLGGTVTLNNNRLLVGGNNGTTSFAGVISGTGQLSKTGTGTMTLTGANDFTGLTTITSGGGLTVTGTGTLASTTVDVTSGTLTTDSDALAAGTTVTVAGTSTFTSSGTDSFTAITQTGGTVNGSGVLTLSGAFNQSGGTTGGTVDINAATFTQSGGATLAAGTTVTSAGAQTLQGGTIAGTLDGAGAVTVNTGTTALTGTGAITAASAIGVASGGTLTSDGDAINDTATVTNGGIFTITGAETIGGLRGAGTTNLTGATLTTGNASINTFSGAMQGTGGLVVQGTNETVLSGTNTFSGGTVINSGILSLANAGSNLSDAGLVTVNAPGTLRLVGDETVGSLQGSGTVEILSGVLTTGDGSNRVLTGSITGAGGLTKQGAGALQLDGAISHTGTTTVNAGALNIQTFGILQNIGDLVVNTGGTLGLDNAHISVDSLTGTGGTIAMTTTNGSASLTLGSDNSDSTFAGGITGDTSLTDLIKEGTGITTVSGIVNTAGSVTVTGGTLALTGNNTITGGINVDGTLRLLTNGAAGGAGGHITTTGSVISYANGVNSATPITIASNTTQLEVLAADAATQSGVISEDAAGRPLEKIGTGTLTLSGANTYTGATTITAGTLIVTSGAALSDTGTVTIANGGTLTVNTNQEAIGNLASSDVATSTAIVNVNAGLVIFGADDTTFDGNITGSTQLTYQGTGSLTLTGANAHTGNLLSSGLGGGNDGTDDGAINITGAGTVASGFILALDGGTITTDGGAFISTANLIVDGANSSATLTGSETISTLVGNGPGIATTGTVTLTGVGTILTLNGSSPFSSFIGSDVTGTGTLNVTGGTATVEAAGDVQVATTIGASGTVINNGTMAAVGNAGSFTNNLTAGALTNTGAGTGSNTGTLASLTHNSTGLFTNTGAVTGATSVSSGTLTLNAGSNLSNTNALTVTGGIVNVNTAEIVGTLAANGGVTNLNAVLTAAKLTGSGSVVGTAPGGLIVGDGVGSSFAGNYSGTGFLQKVGVGTQTMTAANAYSGSTTVSGGTLSFTGSGSALSTALVTIDTGATLLSDGGAYATTLAIINNGTYSQSAGTESIANINGSGVIALVAPGPSRLELNSGASVITGAISGNGGLTVKGSSITSTSGINTNTGTTIVETGGQLTNNGSTVSNLTVNAGGAAVNNGTLGDGTGDLVNVAGTFTNNGTVSGTAATTAATGLITNAATKTINAVVMAGGTVNNSGQVTTTLTQVGGTFGNLTGGHVDGNVDVSGAGTLNNTGTLGNAAGDTVTIAAGSFLNNNAPTGSVVATLSTAGTTVNAGTMAVVNVTGGTFGNAATGNVTGLTTNTGGVVTNNGGTFAAVTNTTGTFNNTTGNAGAVTNAATGTNGGTIASLSNTGGTFNNSGTVTAASTITGGTVTNTGSMAGVTNSATYIATAATTGALINTNTATVTGGTTASVANNAGTTTLAGASVTGAVTNTAGTVTSTGVTTAATVNNSATMNAAGTLDAAVTNNAGGTFNVTGLLDGGAKDFTNAGTLNVITASYGNIATFTNNAGGVVNVTGPQTLSAVTLNNLGGTIIMTGGSTIAGAFTNAAALQSSGTTTINGSFVNTGTVDLANGATGDILNITGATSGTGLYQIDLNLSDGTTDRINAPVGVAEVHLDFDTVGGGLLLPPITVFTGAAAGATLTQQDLPVGGAVLYAIQQTGNDVQVVSSINPAVSGVAASAAMTQSLISTVVNRPTSPFVSGLAAEEGCSNGGYFRASAGVANVQGTATSNGISSTSNISSRFSGVQGGYDIGCFDGRFFDGWDGALGVMAGYNSGSTNQNVFSDPINPTLQTGTSGSDFKQSYLGVYAAGSKDRFSGDLQLRFDQTEFDLKETALAGFEVGLDGINYTTKSTTVGTRFNYRFDLNEDKGINFVPTIGFNYSTVSGNVLTLDDMTTLSTADDETLTINGYNTVVGFLGGTLAKTKIDPEGTSATTTFVSGNYYQDFGGERTASYDSSILPGAEPISIGSIGGFAEASIGLNYVKILDKGPGGAKQLNANVRADARFGPNVSDSYSVTAQIRLSF